MLALDARENHTRQLISGLFPSMLLSGLSDPFRSAGISGVHDVSLSHPGAYLQKVLHLDRLMHVLLAQASTASTRHVSSRTFTLMQNVKLSDWCDAGTAAFVKTAGGLGELGHFGSRENSVSRLRFYRAGVASSLYQT